MKNYIIAALVFLTSCYTATLHEDSFCKSSTLTFTGTNLESKASVQIDLKEVFSKMNSYGTVETDVTKNILDPLKRDLSFVTHAKIIMTGMEDTKKYPGIVLVDQDVHSNTSVDFTTLIPGHMVNQYLSQGAIQLDFTLTGRMPSNSEDMLHVMCLSSKIDVREGI